MDHTTTVSAVESRTAAITYVVRCGSTVRTKSDNSGRPLRADTACVYVEKSQNLNPQSSSIYYVLSSPVFTFCHSSSILARNYWKYAKDQTRQC